ncbi:MAG: T9SS type A sorting domain-containing protein [Bacteroidia bacterium]|jgi:hypothetical protein|nr:T9SS type A sorting domain-containing protein [Bacteroidia bacterium]
MKKLFWIVLLCSTSVFAQFAPQAGLPGTTAIHRDSSIIKNWAKAASIKRGWQNISDTALGLAAVGDETYIPGKAGNGIVSLGDKGEATVLFHNPIKNGEGFDFVVFENGFKFTDSTEYLELAFVEVSSNGKDFFRFPATSLTQTTMQVDNFTGLDAKRIHNLAGKYIAPYGTPFDLDDLKMIDDLDINQITHIRIIDVAGSLIPMYASYDTANRIINEPWPTPFSSSGFDLDGIGVIHEQLKTAINEPFVNTPISVFPNPAKHGEHINLSGLMDGYQSLSIYDITGKNILTGDLDEGIPNNLLPGYYTLTLMGKAKLTTIKLLIQ